MGIFGNKLWNRLHPHDDGKMAAQREHEEAGRRDTKGRTVTYGNPPRGTMTEHISHRGRWFQKDGGNPGIHYDINANRMPGYSESVVSSNSNFAEENRGQPLQVAETESDEEGTVMKYSGPSKEELARRRGDNMKSQASRSSRSASVMTDAQSSSYSYVESKIFNADTLPSFPEPPPPFTRPLWPTARQTFSGNRAHPMMFNESTSSRHSLSQIQPGMMPPGSPPFRASIPYGWPMIMPPAGSPSSYHSTPQIHHGTPHRGSVPSINSLAHATPMPHQNGSGYFPRSLPPSNLQDLIKYDDKKEVPCYVLHPGWGRYWDPKALRYFYANTTTGKTDTQLQLSESPLVRYWDAENKTHFFTRTINGKTKVVVHEESDIPNSRLVPITEHNLELLKSEVPPNLLSNSASSSNSTSPTSKPPISTPKTSTPRPHSQNVSEVKDSNLPTSKSIPSTSAGVGVAVGEKRQSNPKLPNSGSKAAISQKPSGKERNEKVAASDTKKPNVLQVNISKASNSVVKSGTSKSSESGSKVVQGSELLKKQKLDDEKKKFEATEKKKASEVRASKSNTTTMAAAKASDSYAQVSNSKDGTSKPFSSSKSITRTAAEVLSCAVCQKTNDTAGVEIRVCPVCKIIAYCSRKCRFANVRNHEALCASLTQNPEAPKLRACAVCWKSIHELRVCPGCKTEHFCSRDCCKAVRKNHKRNCADVKLKDGQKQLICSNCWKSGTPGVDIWSKCRICSTLYCSVECGEADRADHKLICSAILKNKKDKADVARDAPNKSFSSSTAADKAPGKPSSRQNERVQEQTECAFCHKTAQKVGECLNCKITKYCSVDCKKRDQHEHALICAVLAQSHKEAISKASATPDETSLAPTAGNKTPKQASSAQKQSTQEQCALQCCKKALDPKKMAVCSSCQVTKYCSNGCMRLDLYEHDLVCKVTVQTHKEAVNKASATPETISPAPAAINEASQKPSPPSQYPRVQRRIRCANCWARFPPHKLKVECQACKISKYCSVECLREDSDHKVLCPILIQGRTDAINKASAAPKSPGQASSSGNHGAREQRACKACEKVIDLEETFDCPDCQTIKYCDEECQITDYDEHGWLCDKILNSGGGPEEFPSEHPSSRRYTEREEAELQARRDLEGGSLLNPKAIKAKIKKWQRRRAFLKDPMTGIRN